MIESIFGIVCSSRNYFLTTQQFEFIIKYILDTKYNIEPRHIELRINSIQNKTVLVFNEKERDNIFNKIVNEPFSFRQEEKIKTKLLKEIFQSEDICEEVIYSNFANTKVKGIKFTVKENKKYSNDNLQILKTTNSLHIEKINAQIKVLGDKKMEVIRNNKR